MHSIGPIVRFALFRLLLLKALLFCAALGISVFERRVNIGHFVILTPSASASIAPTPMQRLLAYDGRFYVYIAEHGYQPGGADNAFYPMWPAVIRLGSEIMRIPCSVAGLVAGNLLSLAAAIGLVVLFGECFPTLESGAYGGSGILAGCIFLLYPGNYTLSIQYSESLFSFLVVLVMLGLIRNNSILQCCAFFLPLTRAQGVFCGVLLIYLAFRNRQARVAALAGLLGVGTYFASMNVLCGSPLAGIRAQSYWGSVHSVKHLADPIGFVRGFFDVTSFHDVQGSLVDRLLFIVLIAILPAALSLPHRVGLWVLPLGIVPMVSGHFISSIRYFGLVIPWILLAAALLHTRAKWQAAFLICAIMFALQCWLADLFFRFEWVA